MNCPKCQADTKVRQYRKLTTGHRRERTCSGCGYKFITIEQADGEQFFRPDTYTRAMLGPEQRLAWRKLLLSLSQHPAARQRRDIRAALEATRSRLKIQGGLHIGDLFQ